MKYATVYCVPSSSVTLIRIFRQFLSQFSLEQRACLFLLLFVFTQLVFVVPGKATMHIPLNGQTHLRFKCIYFTSSHARSPTNHSYWIINNTFFFLIHCGNSVGAQCLAQCRCRITQAFIEKRWQWNNAMEKAEKRITITFRCSSSSPYHQIIKCIPNQFSITILLCHFHNFAPIHHGMLRVVTLNMLQLGISYQKHLLFGDGQQNKFNKIV